MEKTDVLIKGIKEGLSDMHKSQQRLSLLESAIIGKIKKLRETIKKGDSSGDNILDLVVLRHGIFNEEVMDKYRELENKFKGKIGQGIVVITEESYRHTWGACYNPEHYSLQKMVKIGKLIGENFIFSQDEFFFPVDSYSKYWNDKLQTVRERMELISYFKVKENVSPSKIPMEPIVLVGEEETRDWLFNYHNKDITSVLHKVFKEIKKTSDALRRMGLEEFLF